MTDVEPFPVPKLVATIAIALLVIAVGFLMSEGYQRNKKADTRASFDRCRTVSAAVVESVSRQVDLGPEILRNWAATPVAPGHGTGWFVSAERIKPDLPKGAKGKIVTWHTTGVPAADADFQSVDVSARTYSTWPRSDLRVSEPDALDSRFCVSNARSRTWHKVLASRPSV
jgi:hypothetical protein